MEQSKGGKPKERTKQPIVLLGEHHKSVAGSQDGRREDGQRKPAAAPFFQHYVPTAPTPGHQCRCKSLLGCRGLGWPAVAFPNSLLATAKCNRKVPWQYRKERSIFSVACSNHNRSCQADKWGELYQVLKTKEISLCAVAEAYLTDVEEPAYTQQLVLVKK